MEWQRFLSSMVKKNAARFLMKTYEEACRILNQGNEDGIQTTLSLQDQHKLAIPNEMWQLILSVPGWFPVTQEP